MFHYAYADVPKSRIPKILLSQDFRIRDTHPVFPNLAHSRIALQSLSSQLLPAQAILFPLGLVGCALSESAKGTCVGALPWKGMLVSWCTS
jgi:hypothetical protein